MSHLLIRNGTLIDGTGRPAVPNAGLLLEDSIIRAAGPLDELPIPDSATTVVDAQGGFILPGFIDTHVHVMTEGHDLVESISTPYSFNYYKAMGHLRRTVEAGITSVRDAGYADIGVKRAIEQGLIAGPRLQISVTVLSITGGHGDDWLLSETVLHQFTSGPDRPDGICDGVDEVRKKVREVLRAGADIIKVCTTGGVLSPTDRPDYVQYSVEELRAMVEEADRRGGVKVMAHAQAARGIMNAVEAGIYSIEHGIYVDDACIEAMLKKGTWLVPTLLAPRAVVEAADHTKNMPEWGLRKAREVIDIHRENIARAYRAGVKIAMGTDCAVGPHGTNLRELALLCEIGMSPMEAIQASTGRAAELMQWQDRVGSLEAGKLADVVIVGQDPLANIATLSDPSNIHAVLQGGKFVKQTSQVSVKP
jgi:imidazolonepropionase-like amidohydrolase